MKAWGFIETVGYIPAIAAVDSMVKSANIELIGAELIGGAMITIVIKGEIGTVCVAVDAGVEAARNNGELVCSNVIAHPSAGTAKVLNLKME